MSALGNDPELHRIESGQFVCLGDENSPCHRYPDCVCETWGEECEALHPNVSHAECWADPWVNAVGLAESHEDDMREDFPDGGVALDWHGDYLTWSYANDRL